MMQFEHYGDIAEGVAYFERRLHSAEWFEAENSERTAALLSATRIIDGFNFKGSKADADQALEFPRGEDTEVPEDIRVATYEIAFELLTGRDPEMELEQLAVTSEGFSAVRTTFNRSQVPTEHLVNGVPSAAAWRILRTYFRDDRTLKLSRVS